MACTKPFQKTEYQHRVQETGIRPDIFGAAISDFVVTEGCGELLSDVDMS